MPKRIPEKAWKPGQSGNPNGSRGRKIMADALALSLNRAADKAAAKACAGLGLNPNDIKRVHVIAEQLAKKAEKGDLVAIKEIFERIDGKVPNVNVEVPFKPAEDMSYEELLTFIAEGHDEGATDSDSPLSRAKPAGNA